jgi:hypothetical protein
MNASATLGVVVQMTAETFIHPSSAAWAGLSTGSIELVGDTASPAGLSLAFDGPASLQRLLDAGQVLLGQMLHAQRQAEQQEQWAARTALAGGRPPLRAVSPDDAVAESTRLASLIGNRP